MKEQAQNNILSLKQTASTRNYFLKFNQYALQTGWDESSLYVHAKSGLKTQVQIEVEKAEQMKAMTRMEM